MMQAKDWFLVIGPLIGVLIGALISSVAKYLELKSQRKFDLEKLKLNKIEEFCHELEAFRISVRKCGETVQVALDNNSPIREFRSGYRPYFEIISTSLGRIRVLQATYVKSAGSEFTELINRLNSFYDTLNNLSVEKLSLNKDSDFLVKAIFDLDRIAFVLQGIGVKVTEPILLTGNTTPQRPRGRLFSTGE